MSENVVRIADYERRSRDPDAVAPRDPSDSAAAPPAPDTNDFDLGQWWAL